MDARWERPVRAVGALLRDEIDFNSDEFAGACRRDSNHSRTPCSLPTFVKDKEHAYRAYERTQTTKVKEVRVHGFESRA